MHRNALALSGLRGSYLPFHVEADDLGTVLPALRTLGFTGLNVTVPLKESVMPHLSTLTEEARRIGAVNTLLRGPSGWEGFNTDAPGFAEAFVKDLDPCPVLVLGAGGAARAVMHALLTLGFEPCVSARRAEKARALATEFSVAYRSTVETAPWQDFGGPWPVVVNALSASSPGELGQDPPGPRIESGGLMADLNYGRDDNWFKAHARKQGAAFRDGLQMLACQARLSFIRWTGLSDIPLDPFLEGVGADLPGGPGDPSGLDL
jgi:shikimate dehydrogenase